jgi:uncharacterized protein YjaG (DUF416 family)
MPTLNLKNIAFKLKHISNAIWETLNMSKVVVEVDLILAKLFHIIVTINLHYNMHTFTTFALILNTLKSTIH